MAERLCLLLLSISSSLQAVQCSRLNILHMNDIHARFEETNQYGGRCPDSEKACYGGAARLQTKLNEIRSKEPDNLLVLNAGDYYQGTVYFNLFNWNITSVFANKVEYDAMALGNHEFDNKAEGLIPFLENINCPILVCNMNVSRVPELKNIGCTVKKQLKTGETVGIIGYLTPETETLSNPGVNVSFSDEITALRSAVKKLQSSGVNIIIALGHSGLSRDKVIAAEVDGIDIVVGGHSHTFLYSGKPPSNDKAPGPYPVQIMRKDGTKALVVQAYAYGLYLGNLSVEFNQNGEILSWEGNPIYLDSSIIQDPEILDILEPYKEAVEEYGGKVVGFTSVLLRGENNYCRQQECNMGNFLTDAVVSYYRTVMTGYKDKPITLAVWNSGGIRAAIDEKINKGEVTVADILTVAPFSNTIDIVEIKGIGLKRMMEQSVARYDPTGAISPGGFLQISGLRVVYDLSKPTGRRVAYLEALCNKCRVPKYQIVEDTSKYIVAIPSYMVQGGDGYSSIKEDAIDIADSGDLDFDVILAYVKRSSPIFVAVEGRIQFLEGVGGGTTCTKPYSVLLILITFCVSYGAL